MSIFEGIEHVSAEGMASNRQYFEAGSYVVTINRVFLFDRRFGGGKLFIVETTVKESNNPNIKTGEQRNWVQSFTLPSALSRIKAFIGAAAGLKNPQDIQAQVTPAICEKVISSDNPLKDRKIAPSCANKITRNGKNFILATWGAYDCKR